MPVADSVQLDSKAMEALLRNPDVWALYDAMTPEEQRQPAQEQPVDIHAEVMMHAPQPLPSSYVWADHEFVNSDTIDPKLVGRDTDTELFRPKDPAQVSPEDLGNDIEAAPAGRKFSSVQELQDVVSPEHRGLFSSPDVSAEMHEAKQGLAGGKQITLESTGSSRFGKVSEKDGPETTQRW